MIDKVKQHGNKLVDEIRSLWSKHIYKVALVLIAVLLVV